MTVTGSPSPLGLKPDRLRLPGVYFLAQPQPAGFELPPLDVAAFVGFAERGPLHLPVAVEDMNVYQAVFGGDLALASLEAGGVLNANLPRAVAGFFANGGRRCYVVRVARDARWGASPAGAPASPSRLRLPGLALVGNQDASGSAARLVGTLAGSPGCWSGRLGVACRLAQTALPAGAFQPAPGGQPQLDWLPGAGSGSPALLAGDLLRLGFAGGSRWLFPISAIQRPAQATAPARLEAWRAWRLLDPAAGAALPEVVEVARLGLDGAEAPIPVSAALAAENDSPNQGPVFCLRLPQQPAAAFRPGDVLRLRLRDGRALLFPLRLIEADQAPGSPPGSEPAVLTAASLLSLAGEAFPASGLASVERLRLDLFLRLGAEGRPPLNSLAFNPGISPGEAHPRFWGQAAALESSLLFDPARQPPSGSTPARPGEDAAGRAARLYHEWYADRLPPAGRAEPPEAEILAGLLAPLSPGGLAALDEAVFLPLDMPGVVTAGDYLLPGPAETGSDGLEAFTADLFLDPYLGGATTLSARALAEAAFDRQYIQERRIYGLLSLMFFEDAALLAVPDAVQPAWDPPLVQESPPVPPSGGPAPDPACGESEFAACQRPPQVYSVDPGGAALGALLTVRLHGAAFTTGEGGAVQVFFGSQPADQVQIISPQELTCRIPGGAHPGPATVSVLASGGRGELAQGFLYLPPSSLPRLPAAQPESIYNQAALVRVQAAAARFCQARGDILAVWSLPRHFELRHCLKWEPALRNELGLPRRGAAATDAAETADLSYAVVYHPWLALPPAGSQAAAPIAAALPIVPPDGAVCGLIAAQERRRQVWVAPANQPLADVLALQPELSSGDWAELFARQVNLIRPEASDFRPMSAHTLSDERSLLQVSVRRLLIALRKLALLRGMDFVFESNHERFRRGVRAALEDLLGGLFRRGAFSGATPDEAFRVIVDDSVNPPQSVEQGRFVVVIQVAPSQPMEFITVLLTRSGPGELQLVEA
jgi:hypothetical protein